MPVSGARLLTYTALDVRSRAPPTEGGMATLRTEICIVGAGAAGLWAAAACARRGAETLVLEKTGKPGTKILASGGSRCNLTTMLDPDRTADHFGPGRNFIRPALRNLSPAAVREHFASIGVPTKTEPAFEKVFPASDSALEVRNAMVTAAERAGAEIRLHAAVTSIQPDGDGWRVDTATDAVWCRALLLSAGGKSYPKTGTTGDGYDWLRGLGLKVTNPVPALVPLTSPASWVHELSGIAVDGELRIGSRRRRRPVLFTHKGTSGPGAMDLSDEVSRGGAREARLDLLPDIGLDALRATLVDAAGQPGSPALASILPLPRRLIEVVAARSQLGDSNPRANQINKRARQRLLEQTKGLQIPISGTTGFAHAEVTAGGLALSQVNRKTMQVKTMPGLYVVGELLDLNGPIGGFSFQAAFSTAELAAGAACHHVQRGADV